MATDRPVAGTPPQDRSELTLGSVRDGDTHVIMLAGVLDLGTVDDVEQELRRVELTCAHIIALDLRGLTFIDSTGIRLLVRAASRSSKGTNRLIVTRGGEAVQRTFEICDLISRLPFVDQIQPPTPTLDGRRRVMRPTRPRARSRPHG